MKRTISLTAALGLILSSLLTTQTQASLSTDTTISQWEQSLIHTAEQLHLTDSSSKADNSEFALETSSSPAPESDNGALYSEAQAPVVFSEAADDELGEEWTVYSDSNEFLEYSRETPPEDTEIPVLSSFGDDMGGVRVFSADEENAIPDTANAAAPLRDVTRYAYTILDDNVKRQAPQVTGEFPESLYPKYGKTSVNNQGDKDKILAENNRIFDFQSIGHDGTLYKNGMTLNKKLTAHPAGFTNYGGTKEQLDKAKAVKKQISLRTRVIGNVITGLYAPPGELITVEVDSQTAGWRPQIWIGQSTQGNHGYDVPAGKTFSRMPLLRKQFVVDKTVTYVGNPLGGPIFINKGDVPGGADITVTITGAVEYPHFIHGTTTAEEYDRIRNNAPAPFFSLETPRGIFLSAPYYPAAQFNGTQIAEAAEFWDKAIGLSYQFGTAYASPNNENTNTPSMRFDPYVAAGAAVNIGGAFCVMPPGALTTAMNVRSMMSGGTWMNLHELNHSYEGWGISRPNTDVGNNAINAMTYQLYTNMDAYRSEATQVSGWNFSANGYLSVLTLKQKNENRTEFLDDYASRLATYTPLQFSFGHQKFLDFVYQSKQTHGRSKNPATDWYKITSESAGYDMTYFIRDIMHYGVSADPGNVPQLKQSVVDEIKKKYPDKPYIPNGLLYASGYVYEGEQAKLFGDKISDTQSLVQQGRPFYVPAGMDKELNLNTKENGGYLALPKGVTAQILEVRGKDGTKLSGVNADARISSSKDGSVKWNGDLKLTYTPPKTVETNIKNADYFDVKMKFTINSSKSNEYNGKTMEVIYRLSFMQETNGAFVELYHTPNEKNLDNAIAKINDSAHVASFASGMAGYSLGNNSYNEKGNESLGVVTGRFLFPEDGTYTVYTKGDDKFELFVSDTAEKLKNNKPDSSLLKASAQSDFQNYTNVKRNTTPTKFTHTAQKGESLYYKAFVLNTGGPGGFQLGYQKDGGNISDIPQSQLRLPGVTENVTTAPKNVYPTEKMYSYTPPATSSNPLYNATGTKLTAVQFWNDQQKRSLNAWGQHNQPKFTVDGNLNTQFHGETSGSSYACSFLFEQSEKAPFNVIELSFNENGRGRIKDYELYASDDKDALMNGKTTGTPISKGTMTYHGRNGYIYLLENISYKYFKVVAKSSHASNGQYYVSIMEVKLGLGIIGERHTVIPKGLDGNSVWTYNKAALSRSPQGLREADSPEAKGSFTFTGTGIVMYAAIGPDYGIMEVSTDNKTWKQVDLYAKYPKFAQQVYFVSGLPENQQNTIYFRRAAGKINIDYFDVQITPKMPQPQSGPPKTVAEVQKTLVTPTVTPMAYDETIETSTIPDIQVAFAAPNAKATFLAKQRKATYILAAYDDNHTLISSKLFTGEASRTTPLEFAAENGTSAKLFVLESDGSYRLIQTYEPS